MHLSRVLSPVIDILTPSLFAVRAPPFEAPAVEAGRDAVDALRGAGAGLKTTRDLIILVVHSTRNEESPRTRRLRSALGMGSRGLFLLVHRRLPRAHDLLGKFRDIFRRVRAQFPDGEAGFALLRR